jgi:deoxyribodipyrimidine photolyase-like uncharacterized protein
VLDDQLISTCTKSKKKEMKKRKEILYVESKEVSSQSHYHQEKSIANGRRTTGESQKRLTRLE